ncbi:MAG: transcription antitermination factor NusB [Bacteroidales bacterium]
MLSRRHFRIKTLQALYAFFLSENDNVAQGEKLLLISIDKLHELYIYQLSLLVEINEFARQRMEDARLKYFPTQDELNPNLRFIDNLYVTALINSSDYQKYFNQYKINWSLHPELIKKMFLEIRDDEHYQKYLETAGDDPKAHSDFISWAINKVFDNNDVLEDLYEDKNIFWGADFSLSVFLMQKTIKYYQENGFKLNRLPPMMKADPDERQEDISFMKSLFTKTILHSDEYEKLIMSKLENWELERIASMDKILIKMALCELQEFSSIPVKVTLNEYIDISKSFSTPKSSYFINGILDKLLVQLKDEKKVVKKGRGLME